ncbi:TPA: S6 family peptidase [Escherichia coli]|nr:autotransporter outer membrane beta-barrel domain-containing protein [Escherichia coli]EIP6825511.1 autotransporter outer membrane beta-barrel domain-containing protein [Escherichia coli]
MNRIYSLRYSAVAKGFVAVYEFARKCVHKSVRRLGFPVLLLLPVLFSAGSLAGTVNNELGYQLFLDFAENKGMFRPGEKNIAIYNKQGELVGTLDKAAMPDFSSTNTSGIATLINPQYVASVKHNVGYQNVTFGYKDSTSYILVDRNEHSNLDFHVPRLNKLVTEVTPSNITAQGAINGAYLDKNRYPAFYRIGSGVQYIKDEEGNLTWLSGAYSYLTGGTVGNPSSYQNGEMISTSSGLVFDYKLNGAMPIYGEAGDSGSPLFAFDTVQNKWVLVGVLTAGNGAGGRGNNWAVIPLDFIGQKFNEDNDAPVTFRTSEDGTLEWSFNSSTGAGTLTQGTTIYAMHGQQGNDLNAGKNLEFLGQNGQIDLKDSVVQGAGSLTFHNDYTVATSNNSTWTGAGIIVDKGVSVNWQVNGVKGDDLHKIGEGTLTVQGTGINEGGLKVGDGNVILNQQSDNKGQVQAFSSVNIASGRPTVVLTDDRQVNPDNITWGYRGGILDVNGNDIAFHEISAADYGAQIYNSGNKNAAISLVKHDVIQWTGKDTQRILGRVYEYFNDETKKAEFFILNTTSTGWYPTPGEKYLPDMFRGADYFDTLEDADKEVKKNTQYIYHGKLTGNISFNPESVGTFVMDGSADMSGTFTYENGRLTLQGHPVIHAYNTQSVADKLAASGDNSVLTQPTSFSQEDWENRSFTFDRLSLKNTDFGLGRNATLNTMLEATDSTVTLGDERVFIDKNDGNGTAFSLEEGTSEAVKDADRSVFNGSAVLNGKTTLDIMNATFNGDISGHAGSHVELSRRSIWNMTKSSTLDSFRSKGGTLSLVTDNWSPKTLTVNTLHASSMNIAMGVSTADNTGDRIDILNKATGGHNTLDLSSLFEQTVTLKNDLTLASAPVGTSHEYFSFASLNRGFTVYTPDTQVQEKDGRVYWQLKSHAGTTESQVSTDVSDDVTDTTSPVAPDTGSTGSTEANGIVSEGNNSNGVSPSPDSPAENAGTMVNGSTLFKGADNTSLLKKARAMFAAREFILSDSADRWTQVVDNSDADGGAWAMTGYSHGGYDDFSLNQSGLNVGFRQSAAGNAWWGMGAEFYRGHSSTDDYRDDFSLWGVHVLAGKSFAGGLFVDGMTGYRELSEDYTIQGELSDLSGRAKSHILTAGIRGGWKMHAAPFDMSITPTVSLNGARVDGNRLQGRERSVELHDGDALWLKAGVEAEKVSGNMTLKAGIWRNITLNDMPGMTLRDDWKARHYDAEKADRYTVSFGFNGKLTEKLSVQAKVNSSLDGYFKTDAEGILGIRYDF